MARQLPLNLGIKPSWKIRRRIVVITLLWCGLMVSYLAIWGRDIDLSSTIANGVLLLMASVIGSYVFGAVWDTKIERESVVSQMAVEQGMPPQQTTQNVTVQGTGE